MAKKISPISFESTVIEHTVNVNAAPGSVGAVVPFWGQTTIVSINNISCCAVDFRFGSGPWFNMEPLRSLDVRANLASDPLYLRRNSYDGGIAQVNLSIECMPVAAAAPIYNRALPQIVFVGDSTGAYSNSLSGSALSLVNNYDGSASLTFAADMGIAVGDKIGVQGCAYPQFKVRESVVTAVVKNAQNQFVYTYTLAPGMLPPVAADGGAETCIRYVNRASAAGPLSWLMGFSGRKLRCINACQIGDTLPKILDRFDVDVGGVAVGGYVVLMAGINDVATGRTSAQYKSDFSQLLGRVRAIGARLIAVTPFPQIDNRANWSAQKAATLAANRQFLVQNAQELGYLCIDWGSLSAGSMQIMDPALTTGAPFQAVVNADKIHPLNNAAYMLGKALSQVICPQFGLSAVAGIPRAPVDCGLLSNGLMQGAAGTAGPGVSGAIATGINVSISAGVPASVNCYQTARSYAVDGDIAGNWQGVTVVAAAAGDQVRVKFPDLFANLQPGQTCRFEILARLASGAVRGFELTCNSQTVKSGNLQVTDMQTGTSQMGLLPEPFTVKMGFDAPIRATGIAGDNPSQFIPVLQVTAAGPGSLSFEFACASAFILS